jgi:dTDP-L-rhamnose 4-epimerase
MGTVNLIESVRAVAANSTPNIILAASRAVYGEGAYEDSTGRVYVGLPRRAEAMSSGDFDVPLPEKAVLPARACPSMSGLPVAPASIYASTKLMQEYLLCQSGEGANWRAACLRLQNVYGPGQSLRNPYTGVLSIFAWQLLEGKTLSIYEDGLISRDFVYVDDVVDALVRAGQSELNHGSTIDIGSGEAVSILDVAKILMQHLDCTDDSYRITGEFRVGDIRHACADIKAASEQLGWKPRVSLRDGLSALADWAKQEFVTKELQE